MIQVAGVQERYDRSSALGPRPSVLDRATSKEGTGLVLISTELLAVTHLALVTDRYRSYSYGS